MSQTQILIAGAGPTGLALALWLARLGVRFRIVDLAVEAGTTSRALAVHARTLEFYRQVGIADAVVERGVRVEAVNLWGRGRKAMRLPLGQIGQGLSPFPYVLDFPQDEHERFLIDRLDELGVNIERRTELIRYEQKPESILATLRRPDGSEEVCEAAYLAGCDGAHSAVRAGFGTGFPGSTYEGLFYVADVDAGGPPIDGEVHIDLDDGDFLAIFPYKHANRVRLIGALRRDPGHDGRELTFEDVRGRAIEQMRLTIRSVNWFSTYRVHHRVADRFRNARAFLLGDAAHIHSPVGGQGMNTGIGDAVNLSWKLASALNSVLNDMAADSLLDTYETERIRFARRLVATTDRAFTFVTKPGRLAEFVRLRVVPAVLPWLMRLPPVRRFAFRTVSQISIEYRGSPLSAGAAGDIRGGDRLPWVPSAVEDNYTPLAALAWQVHVYGEPQPGLGETCAKLKLPLHVFPWRSEMRRSGFARNALYLVRPDGYVALAEPRAHSEGLRRYFSRFGSMVPRR